MTPLSDLIATSVYYDALKEWQSCNSTEVVSAVWRHSDTDFGRGGA